MKLKNLMILSIVMLFFVQPQMKANDGRDRYAGAYANELCLFPDAPVLQSGYRVLSEDGPGGADGDRAFRWTRLQSIALVRIAAHETAVKLGDANYNMAIFDLSAENGDTPVQFDKEKPPRGRHPGGSHDGGLNLDLGYYLTSLKGAKYSPDHSACTDHFQKDKDTYICNGPPDRLDVERQSFFMLQLLKINRDLFNGHFLEQIGMDWKIQEVILYRLNKWVKENKFAAHQKYIDDFKQICTADLYEGWAYAHHHHLHLRLREISLYGKHRAAFLKLFKKERTIDFKLLSAAAKPGETVLRTRLRSYAMERSIEVEVPRAFKKVKFRVEGGQWVEDDPSFPTRRLAVLSLPTELSLEPKTLKIEAALGTDNDTQTISAVLGMPRLEPYLFVSVDPKRLEASFTRTGNRWKLQIKAPKIYKTYITGVYFEIFRQEGDVIVKKKYDASMTDYSYLHNAGNSPNREIKLIRAQVVLASRMRIKLPIYAK
ncbi:MAG: hypothetical protein GY765_10455 [bacterium]|nr:hypothetical protein [bacterium]